MTLLGKMTGMLNVWACGGSSGQPRPGLDETVLSQPKQHPSSKFVSRCYGISSDRLIRLL